MQESQAGEAAPREIGFHLVMIHERFRAICTCGWQSPSVATAGIAESAWDMHAGEEHPQ